MTFHNRPIRKELTITISLILLFSFLSTLLFWGLSIFMLLKEKVIQPANYVEQKIPQIHQFIQKHEDNILDPHFQSIFDEEIPQGVWYQVLDEEGRFVYGSFSTPVIHNKKEMIQKLNRQESRWENEILNYVPITDGDGRLHGVFVARYYLQISVPGLESERWVTRLVNTFFNLQFLIVPFIFIVVYTILFGRRFSRKMNQPIEQLMEGIKRIAQQDLNFSFAYEGKNELAQLTQAFEELRKELKDSLQREWRLEQERKDMIAAIAHDLRTPLAIIQGHVEGLQLGALDNRERLEQYLHTIGQNTKRATKLIADLNTVTELERPDFNLQLVPVDMERFFNEKIADYQTLCEHKKVQFKGEYIDLRQEQEKINLDSDRLIQVLDNLVDNSMRFSKNGGLITWMVEVTEEALHMSISDQGPGFSDSELHKVFDHFYQSKDKGTREKGHAGLGLYIAKLLVEQHNGEIWAENRNPAGAIVKLTIPIKG